MNMEILSCHILTPEERSEKRRKLNEDPILAEVYKIDRDLVESIAPTPLVIVELEGQEVWCASLRNPTPEDVEVAIPDLLKYIVWYEENKPLSVRTNEKLAANPMPMSSGGVFNRISWRKTA